MSDTANPFQLLAAIDRQCRALAAGLPAQQQVAQTWSGIGFRLGEQTFVSPMGEIGEILHEPRYTALPGVQGWVKGVANVRGRLLPILDLCAYFGQELSALRKQRRVLVVDHNDIYAGLIVDEVFGMQHFAVSSYNEETEPVTADLAPFVHGQFLRERVWLTFSPHQLVAHQRFLGVAV